MRLSRRQLIAAGATLGFGPACKSDPLENPAADPKTSSSGGMRGISTERDVIRIIPARPTLEGAGVHIHRALGGQALSMLDPFLLLDEFQSDNPDDYAAGFPEHPHRGFETVTYMIDGAMEHRDNVGNRGRLGPGSAQWMTAGHGIVHSEMPKQERGLMWGYQLWVNLPKAHKLMKPRYQDIKPERIPEIAHDGANVRLVAGSLLGKTGPVDGIDVDPLFLDVAVEKGVRFVAPTSVGHNAFVYVTDGAIRLGPSRTEVRRGQLALLTGGEQLTANCDATSGRMLVIAGRPIGEPVSRRGPFVMNTDDEIRQAYDDYRAGVLTAGI